jgi:hypothetical protein
MGGSLAWAATQQHTAPEGMLSTAKPPSLNLMEALVPAARAIWPPPPGFCSEWASGFVDHQQRCAVQQTVAPRTTRVPSMAWQSSVPARKRRTYQLDVVHGRGNGDVGERQAAARGDWRVGAGAHGVTLPLAVRGQQVAPQGRRSAPCGRARLSGMRQKDGRTGKGWLVLKLLVRPRRPSSNCSTVAISGMTRWALALMHLSSPNHPHESNTVSISSHCSKKLPKQPVWNEGHDRHLGQANSRKGAIASTRCLPACG